MGSQLTKNYDVEKDPCTYGGTHGVWKIYAAKKKDKQGTPVSIFMYDKSKLDKRKYAREIEEFLNKLRQEVNVLVRFKHPNLLGIIEPLMEDAKTLAFVTEPIEHCLADLLKRPQLLASVISDTEIRLGLLDISAGLAFLHQEARHVHLGISPENLYMAPGGKWKIAGLISALQMQSELSVDVDTTDIIYAARSQTFSEPTTPLKLVPNMFFAAPEVICVKKATFNSDLYSLGCVIYSVYKVLTSLNTADSNLLQYDEFSENGHKTAAVTALRNSNMTFACLPDVIRPMSARLISIEPRERGSLTEFNNSPAFHDHTIKAFHFIEQIEGKQDAQKIAFFKSLTKILEKFDLSLLKRRMLPAMMKAMHDINLIPYVIPNMIKVIKHVEINPREYQKEIWPTLSQMAAGKQISAQTFFVLLSEIELLISLTEWEQCKAVLMPLAFKGFECGVSQIEEVLMKKMKGLCDQIEDKGYIKVQVLPRFLNCLVNSKSTKVRETALKSLSKIYNLFDRPTLVDTVLPTLTKIRRLDVTPVIVMNLAMVYDGVSKLLGHKVTCQHILPSFLPLIVEGDLNQSQFQRLCSVVDEMFQRVKDARANEIGTYTSEDPSNPQSNVVGTELSEEDDLQNDNMFEDFFGQNQEEEPGESFFDTPKLQATPEPIFGTSQPAMGMTQPSVQSPQVDLSWNNPTTTPPNPQTTQMNMPPQMAPQVSQPAPAQQSMDMGSFFQPPTPPAPQAATLSMNQGKRGMSLQKRNDDPFGELGMSASPQPAMNPPPAMNPAPSIQPPIQSMNIQSNSFQEAPRINQPQAPQFQMNSNPMQSAPQQPMQAAPQNPSIQAPSWPAKPARSATGPAAPMSFNQSSDPFAGMAASQPESQPASNTFGYAQNSAPMQPFPGNSSIGLPKIAPPNKSGPTPLGTQQGKAKQTEDFFDQFL